MNYSEYIKIGFTRENYQDRVVFDEIGYHPFFLTKIINERMKIHVDSEELDNPLLMIYTNIESQTVERVPLTRKQVLGILGIEETTSYYSAC